MNTLTLPSLGEVWSLAWLKWIGNSSHNVFSSLSISPFLAAAFYSHNVNDGYDVSPMGRIKI